MSDENNDGNEIDEMLDVGEEGEENIPMENNDSLDLNKDPNENQNNNEEVIPDNIEIGEENHENNDYINDNENIKQINDNENNDLNDNENFNQINDDEKVEVEDRGVNTDELPEEELQKIIENNKELLEENQDLETSNNQEEQEEKVRLQKELTEELNEKNKIYELLLKSNNELKNKIEISNKKYNEILQKIEEKKQGDVQQKIELQIKELEKEINANTSETERYKKLIDQLKNKLEFKTNLERSSNLKNILKEEMLRNKELKEQLNALCRLNKVQNQYIKNYDKENQISSKLEILNKEIQQAKDTIKEYQTKNNKLDRFIKLIHEKIVSIEMIIKKNVATKDEPKKKLFTKEELKDTLDLINNLKTQVIDKRNQLNALTKQNDNKINKMQTQNKQIELDFKENEKINKMLIFKRNELKKNIKNVK